MKKFLSILIVTIMFVSIFSIPAFSANNNNSDFKYYDKLTDYNHGRAPEEYIELFYHYSDKNREEPDWTLIYVYTDGDLCEMKFGAVVGDVVLWSLGGGDLISSSRYLVYITELETFISVEDRNIEQIIEHCPDLVEVVEKFDFGQKFGDVNDDMKIDVLDATYIQRMLAGYNDDVKARYVPYSDKKSSLSILEYVDAVEIYVNEKWDTIFISDFDRDGETTVMDATMIQRHLVGLE